MTEYILKDGKGTGSTARVDNENRLRTFSVVNPRELHVNQTFGDNFLVFTNSTPTAANDVFFYIKNTSTKDMVIQWYRIWSASGAADAIDIYL